MVLQLSTILGFTLWTTTAALEPDGSSEIGLRTRIYRHRLDLPATGYFWAMDYVKEDMRSASLASDLVPRGKTQRSEGRPEARKMHVEQRETGECGSRSERGVCTPKMRTVDI